MTKACIIVLLLIASASRASATTNGSVAPFLDLFTGNLMKFSGRFVGTGIELTSDFLSKYIESFKCKPVREPDECRDVPQMIEARGFKVEEHKVVSRDGYQLTLHRVRNPLIRGRHRHRLRPVLLMHGLSLSSNDFVFASTDVRPVPWPCEDCDEPFDPDPANDQQHPRSLAYYLANKGYDVWLGNSRGNRYAQHHVYKDSTDSSFWDFSLDEQIEIDLPDTIEYIQAYTRFLKIGYVGYSQGSMIMFGLMAERPEYSNVIEPFIALGPCVYVHHIRSKLRDLLPLERVVHNVRMRYVGNDLVRFTLQQVCIKNMTICNEAIYSIFGYDPEGHDTERTLALLHHVPSGTSSKSFAHFAQGVTSKNFTKFDFGWDENILRYGQPTPPHYDISRIRSKSIVLFSSGGDTLSDSLDVRLLEKNLRVKPLRHYVLSKETDSGLFNHAHYVYGKYAGVLVNRRIINIMDHFYRMPRKKLRGNKIFRNRAIPVSNPSIQ